MNEENANRAVAAVAAQQRRPPAFGRYRREFRVGFRGDEFRMVSIVELIFVVVHGVAKGRAVRLKIGAHRVAHGLHHLGQGLDFIVVDLNEVFQPHAAE